MLIGKFEYILLPRADVFINQIVSIFRGSLHEHDSYSHVAHGSFGGDTIEVRIGES
jgi:hypothetical protein